jgi:hypothetical protein
MVTIDPSTIYGISKYGTSYYGLGQPLNYIVDPFTAIPYNYQVINLAWQQCSNPILEFRLLRNRFGYPIDQNDGEVLLDETTWPGNQYVDDQILQGSYHYYGIYLLVTQGVTTGWIRAGLTACLIQQDLSSDNWLFGNIPLFMRNIDDFELTQDSTGNLFLYQFMEVIGWGLDYLKTQYNLLLQANNPQTIPLNDLMGLAATIGYDFEPEIAAGVMRKGIANAPHVYTERGTMLGITNETNILTGWEILPTLGYNQMLEDDHGFFVSPVTNYPAWDATVSYHIGEHVTVGNFIYTSNTNNNKNHVVNTGGNNTNWNVYTDADDTVTLANPDTGGINTWEARYTSASGQVPTSNSCREGVGICDPISLTSFTRCGVRVYNQGGSPQTCELRSIARTTTDLSSLNTDPDPLQVILDGTPVPHLRNPSTLWQGDTEIETNTIVSYAGQPFIALRPSTNVPPPLNTNLASNEWQPIGLDPRIALMISGYLSQSLTNVTNCQTAVTPYVVWYDKWGRYISQVFSRCVADQVADVRGATASALPSNVATATTLTASVNSAFPTIDGVNYTTSQTILVQNEAAQANNGLYSLTTAGSGASKWVLTRTATPNTTYPGLTVEADFGTVNAGLLFYCQNLTTPTFGTTAITFTQSPVGQFNLPNQLYFDSFTNGLNTTISGSAPDIGAATWTLQTGAMTTNPYNNGVLIPVQGTRSYATMATQANCQLGVTFTTLPDSGNSQGIIFRWSNDNNYWRADQNSLTKKVAGVFTIVANHSTPFSALDRMNITLNGSSITCYRNGVSVSSVTDAFNSTQVNHGCIYEPTTTTNFPTMTRQSSSTRKRTTKSTRPSKQRRFEPGFGQGNQGSTDVPERQPRAPRRKPPLKRTGHEFGPVPPPVVLPPTPPDRIRRRRQAIRPLGSSPRRREQK